MIRASKCKTGQRSKSQKSWEQTQRENAWCLSGSKLTEFKSGKYEAKYLLVFIDTFSGWTETFSTKHETVQVVRRNY